jgi:hypothetical protein
MKENGSNTRRKYESENHGESLAYRNGERNNGNENENGNVK